MPSSVNRRGVAILRVARRGARWRSAGHAGHRGELLVHEYLAVDGVLIDVVERDRSTGRGNLTGEALTDRDPDTLLDLFFQATGGGGDQLPDPVT
jgi:hypothetical protein